MQFIPLKIGYRDPIQEVAAENSASPPMNLLGYPTNVLLSAHETRIVTHFTFNILNVSFISHFVSTVLSKPHDHNITFTIAASEEEQS